MWLNMQTRQSNFLLVAAWWDGNDQSAESMKIYEWLFNITRMSWMGLNYLWSFESVHQFHDSLQIVLLRLTVLTLWHCEPCWLLSAAQRGWSCILESQICGVAYDQRLRVFVLYTLIAIFFHLPRVKHLHQRHRPSRCSKGWRTNLMDGTSWWAVLAAMCLIEIWGAAQIRSVWRP